MLATALFVAAIVAFVVALMAFDVLPNPLARSAAKPAPNPTMSPIPESARFAKPGDCVNNLGTDDDPEMILVTCTTHAYKVLARLEETTDTNECDAVEGYQYHYYYRSELGQKFNFVLCLSEVPG